MEPSLPDPIAVEQYHRAMKAINDYQLDSLQPVRVGRHCGLAGRVARALGLKNKTVEGNRLHIKLPQDVWLVNYAQVRKVNANQKEKTVG